MAVITPSRRVRSTPFTAGVEAAGVTSYTVYNHMLLPSQFGSYVDDYHHLKRKVQVWDVACERQVQIKGPQAMDLVDILTPRDMSRLVDGRCLYIPVCDQDGGMLNDPVALKPAEDTVWISIADSDLLQWIKAVAACKGFDVEVSEPDVSPLGVQGPLSDDLMERVFGPEVRDIRFFGWKRLAFQDQNFIVARSGYSKQGGFEIYVEGHDNGMPLWDALFAAGEEFEVRAGCPNLIERIEAGLLSYGNDMTIENTPLECGLGKYVSAAKLDSCFGGRRLKEDLEAGHAREIRAISIEGDLPPCNRLWPAYANGTQVGQVTSATWSPDFNTNVAIGMVERAFWDAGQDLEVETQDGMRRAKVQEAFWI